MKIGTIVVRAAVGIVVVAFAAGCGEHRAVAVGSGEPAVITLSQGDQAGRILLTTTPVKDTAITSVARDLDELID